ncbi:MAG: DNA primase noncatalytic subunit PriX [Candidatus Micrarchaeota archaeon]|nr:DNA primase noncatalytic subunit PriX [Candidatus Micrarchaeota archaeon]
MEDNASLDFAAKYPFTEQARRIVESLNLTAVEPRYLDIARARVEEDMSDEPKEYGRIPTNDLKRNSLVGYLYSRLLVSAMSSDLALSKYATGEARKAASAMEAEDDKTLSILADSIGIKLSKAGPEYSVGLIDYLGFRQRSAGASLANQRLSNGTVFLQRYKLIRLLQAAAESAIRRGLPIPANEIPDEVLKYAKSMKAPQRKAATQSKAAGSYAWIEQVLANPIPDVRHRTVNLVLAPYLVNVKGMDEEQAFEVISRYIERCKELDPNTKINDSYIRYQCRYAKAKGLRPLSLAKARSLLSGVIDKAVFPEGAAGDE